MNLKAMLLQRFSPVSKEDYVKSIKRLIQEFALIGLWRAKFFESCAFYGGTAHRICYDLPRFSKDLDFTLLKRNGNFDLTSYFNAIMEELQSAGLQAEIIKISKSSVASVESALIKANTKIHFLRIGMPSELLKFPSNEFIKVKFEVDTNPPHSL
ncbi:MAG TPA: nucleotidyl transferase AbiEii/AbiGii toxin family protein [Candidatus Cloacimonadota bacterium]|nr:nucleotidyl transferase AbiEii/AbiGii toxin family protein [Candidatus Cloacimonadota bacterium]